MPKLPKFQTDEELIAWFDTHDTADYIDEMEEADETFAFLPTAFATRPVDLRLRADLFFAIERLADLRGIAYQRLMKDWLQEKRAQEAPELLLHP